MVDTATLFEVQRPRLFGAAYRMVGSRAEAEDLVQEAFVRWQQAERSEVRNPQAWLVTAVTRLAIDRLRSLKTEREAYRGPWLPEPLIGRDPPEPDRKIELDDDLSTAFLVMLERLGPEESGLFLLRDVFEVGYRDLAEAFGRTEEACRQAVRRARLRLASGRRRFEVSEGDRMRLLERFSQAVALRDKEALLDLFAPDSEWTSDGGEKVNAVRRVIRGPDRIARLVLGIAGKFYPERAGYRLGTVNGEAGLLWELDGRVLGALSIATDGKSILALYQVVNPDKLGSADPRPVTGKGSLPSTR